jgi:hypothetical protein
VTELMFNRELYQGTAVDEAVKLFAGLAAFELAEAPRHFIVRVTASTPERERKVAGELGNYALGLTVKHRGAR